MIVEPVVRHTWWSVRRRALLVLLVLCVHAIALVIVYARLDPAVVAGGAAVPQAGETFAASWAGFLRETWGGGLLDLLALAGIVLTVGGVAAERRTGTLDLTLSLPVARWVWLAVRGATVLFLLVALSAAAALIVTAGGWILGEAVPVGVVMGSIFIGVVGSIHVVTAALLTTTLTRESLVAALIAFGIVYITSVAGEVLGGWAPGLVLKEGAWSGGPPWRALASSFLLAAVFAGLAVRRFASIDP